LFIACIGAKGSLPQGDLFNICYFWKYIDGSFAADSLRQLLFPNAFRCGTRLNGELRVSPVQGSTDRFQVISALFIPSPLSRSGHKYADRSVGAVKINFSAINSLNASN